jgi:hypothetical protein
MTTRKPPAKSVKAVPSPITQVLGSWPVLPGESEAVYQQGLIATVQELGATTPLQIYLAEKIYECLWWMRRYENQKRATLIRKMAQILAPSGAGSEVTELEAAVTQQLHNNHIDDALKTLFLRYKLDIASLTQKAMAYSRAEHVSLDEMIAVKAKTLAGFQASYEVLVNRKVNAERMRLQNALMTRDLGAIDMESADVAAIKPPKTPGK